MKNTEYGLWVKTLAKNDQEANYVRWDEFEDDWATKDSIRKALKEIDEKLVSMEKRIEIDTRSADYCWFFTARLTRADGTTLTITTHICLTTHEAACSIIARINVMIDSLVVKEFVDNIRPRAAAVGLIIETKHYRGHVEDDEFIYAIAVYYGKSVPIRNGGPNSSESNDTKMSYIEKFNSRNSSESDFGMGTLLETVELHDLLWQSKIINIIQFYEARPELGKFFGKFPDTTLRFSPDGYSLEVPYQYRPQFIEESLNHKALNGGSVGYTQEETAHLVHTLNLVPITKENIEILSEAIIASGGDSHSDSSDDIPEDIDGGDTDG